MLYMFETGKSMVEKMLYKRIKASNNNNKTENQTRIPFIVSKIVEVTSAGKRGLELTYSLWWWWDLPKTLPSVQEFKYVNVILSPTWIFMLLDIHHNISDKELIFVICKKVSQPEQN